MEKQPGSGGKRIIIITFVVLGSFFAHLPILAVTAASQQEGNEGSAIGGLRAIANGQAGYAGNCGRGGYATTFKALATPPPGRKMGFITSDFATGDKPTRSGYIYALFTGKGFSSGPKDCNGNSTVTAYYATAVPEQFGKTGSRSFALDSRGAIWANGTAKPPTEPFGPPSIQIVPGR